MHYKIDSSEFELPTRLLDWTDRLPESLSKDCELLFGVEDVAEWDADEPHAVANRVEMLAALERLLHLAMTRHDLFPQRFTFNFEIFPGVPVEGDDEVHSIALPNRDGFYMLSGGEGRCVLEKVDVGDDRRLHRSNPVDISQSASIETKSHGVINIVKSSDYGVTIKRFKKLKTFLETNPGEFVEKRLG